MAGLALLAGTAVCHAEENYLGAAVGRGRLLQACDSVEISCTTTDTGWKVFAGLAHYHGFHLEFAYGRLGEAQASGVVAGTEVTATKEVSVFEISALKDFSLFYGLGVYGKGGLYHYEVEVEASAPVPNFAARTKLSSGGFSYTFALGARYDVTRSIALRAEWQRYKNAAARESASVNGVELHVGKTDVDFASAQVLYRF